MNSYKASISTANNDAKHRAKYNIMSDKGYP